jgi:hypothetical protein
MFHTSLAVKRLQKEHPPAYMPLNGNPLDHSALIEALSSRPIEPIEVKGGGMAFTLIRRAVLDSIKRSNPETGEAEVCGGD